MDDQPRADGDRAETVACAYTDDCGAPAAYVVERFSYPKGVVETPACEAHTEAYLERFSEERVRPLTRSDSE